jgi:hypothetical protein
MRAILRSTGLPCRAQTYSQRALSLQNRAESLECSPRLTLRYAADERAACQRAQRTERSVKLVAVIEARAAVGGFAQAVLGAGARAGRAAPLPDGEPGRLALHQSPMYVEANSSQMDLLVHPQAHPRRSLLAVAQPAVNGDPIAQPMWIHRHVPYLVGVGRDLDRGGDRAHSACNRSGAPRSARGQRLDPLPLTQCVFYGRVKAMKLDVEPFRHTIVGRQQIAAQSLHQWDDQLGALACE